MSDAKFDKAIERLCQYGFTSARTRRWSYGNTIMIPVGTPTYSGSMVTYPTVLYLYRDRDKRRWHLLAGAGTVDPAATYESLDEAVEGVREYAKRYG